MNKLLISQRTKDEQREEIQWHEKRQIEAWEAVEKLKAEKRNRNPKHKWCVESSVYSVKNVVGASL